MKKKKIIVGIALLVIICVILCIMFMFNKNNGLLEFDKVISSGTKTVVIFENNQAQEEKLKNILEENNVNFISIDVSKLKDNDKNKLKTTLDLENLTTYYGAIIENNDVLRKIYLKDIETNDNEKIMQMLAYYGVLENSKEYLNDYNYKMGVEALNNGLIYSANSYLKSVDKDYKDVNELLKDKRFFLLNKYHYDYPDNIRKMTFQYLPNDKIYHDSFVGEEYNQKAYVKNDIIYICTRSCDSEYANTREFLHIDYVNETELKFKEWDFVLKKVD